MKVLLVEDSPEVSLITVEYLVELGHRVVPVANAEIALSQVDAENFDVVMTDVSLPGMSGIELARELLTRRPALPVVIASGYGSLDLQALLGPEQANIFTLSKPYDMETLETTLAKAAVSGAVAK